MSQNPHVRLRQHRWSARNRARSAVHKWMAKRGPDSIQMSILKECDSYEHQCEQESLFISEIPNLLNHGAGGRGRPRGSTWSTEERRKHEEWASKNPHPNLGRKFSPQARANMSAARAGRRGHHPTPETRAKLSRAKLGRRNPNWGKSPSAETEARRIAALGDPNRCIGAQATVSWDDVRDIRASGDSNAELAHRYGISVVSIWRIRTNRTWKEK